MTPGCFYWTSIAHRIYVFVVSLWQALHSGLWISGVTYILIWSNFPGYKMHNPNRLLRE